MIITILLLPLGHISFTSHRAALRPAWPPLAPPNAPHQPPGNRSRSHHSTATRLARPRSAPSKHARPHPPYRKAKPAPPRTAPSRRATPRPTLPSCSITFPPGYRHPLLQLRSASSCPWPPAFDPHQHRPAKAGPNWLKPVYM
jgi:hypothetical protein